MILGTFVLSTALAQAPPPIVNGEETSDFPQVGMLYYEGGRGSGLCSATLIHEQWVMTAAHCVASMDGGGTTYFMVGTDWDEGLERYTTITEMHIQPDYTGSGYHDIGLMKLQHTFSMDPMPLNDDPFGNSDLGKEVTYVGWGNSNNNGGGSGTKRTVTVNIDAVDWYNIYTYDESGNQGNVCSGDSGGAALMPTEDGGWKLVGVNAFIYVRTGGQAQCDHPEGAAGATRVDKYLDWVGDYVDYTIGAGEGDADTDTDADTDSDTDADTDTELDTGWWDDELPARPDSETLSSGGGCATAQSPAVAAWLLPLLALVRRRRV